MTEPEILFERRGHAGIVILNRPKALNALSLAMIRAFDAQLQAWAADDGVGVVVTTGAGGRAFCAGGDVAGLCREGMAARRGETVGNERQSFFHAEYRLDRRIARYPKPYVSLIDGVCMGGGVGISAHAPHRVVTERTLFAMPETAIGLFPDVGGSYLLPRLPGRLGLYLGLTGERLTAADLIYTGIASAYTESARLSELLAALAADGRCAETVAAVVTAFGENPPETPSLAAHRGVIDQCFAADTVEGIVAALAAQPTPWTENVLATLRRMSPTSLKLSLTAYLRGAAMSLEDCLVMEHRLSQGCMAGHDFYEGVRAVLIDKDKNPQWSPSALEDVTMAMVEEHFAPPSGGDLIFD